MERGQGLAHKREAEAELKVLKLQKTKPFARTRDDPDLKRMLKELYAKYKCRDDPDLKRMLKERVR